MIVQMLTQIRSPAILFYLTAMRVKYDSQKVTILESHWLLSFVMILLKFYWLTLLRLEEGRFKISHSVVVEVPMDPRIKKLCFKREKSLFSFKP